MIVMKKKACANIGADFINFAAIYIHIYWISHQIAYKKPHLIFFVMAP